MVTITGNLRLFYNIYCNIIFDTVIYNMSLSYSPENELFKQWGKPPRPNIFIALFFEWWVMQTTSEVVYKVLVPTWEKKIAQLLLGRVRAECSPREVGDASNVLCHVLWLAPFTLKAPRAHLSSDVSPPRTSWVRETYRHGVAYYFIVFSYLAVLLFYFLDYF